MLSKHLSRSLLRATSALCAVLVAACSTVPLETAAPLVSAAGNGPHLAHGRHLYLTRCAKCHQVYPVKNYTPSEWNPILTEMSKDAKLNAQEEAAVRAYVAAALKSP